MRIEYELVKNKNTVVENQTSAMGGLLLFVIKCTKVYEYNKLIVFVKKTFLLSNR